MFIRWILSKETNILFVTFEWIIMFVFETMQSAHGSSYSIREFHHWKKDLYLQMRNESFFRWFLIGAYHLIAIDKEPCSFYHNLFVSICF